MSIINIKQNTYYLQSIRFVRKTENKLLNLKMKRT